MTAAERGVLMLTCPLGQENVPTLTPLQFAKTAKRVREAQHFGENPMGELTEAALYTLGFSLEQSARLVKLLSREDVCSDYLAKGEAQGAFAFTQFSAHYPAGAGA